MSGSPQGKGPQRFGRSDARWSPGERLAGRSSGWTRVRGPGAKWPVNIQSTFYVGSGWCPGAASGTMTTTMRDATPETRLIASGQVLGKQLHDRARQGDCSGARPQRGRSTHDLAAVPASEARTHPHHTLSRVDVAAAQSHRLDPTTPGGAGRIRRVHRHGLSFSSLVAADREGPDTFYPADRPQTAKPSTTLFWEGTGNSSSTPDPVQRQAGEGRCEQARRPR